MWGSRVQVPYAPPEKSIDFVGAFFNEINPFRICEMHFVREILLRNVKYALRRVDLFHFTESDSFLFHNFDRNYFTSSEARYFTKNMRHLNRSAPPEKTTCFDKSFFQ